MASSQAIAMQRSASLASISQSRKRISEKLLLDNDDAIHLTSSDQEFIMAARIAGIAKFMQRVADKLTGEQTMSNEQEQINGGIQPDHTGGKSDREIETAQRDIRSDADQRLNDATKQARAKQVVKPLTEVKPAPTVQK